jgi:hypothetical protein
LSELRAAKQNVANLQAEANEELPAGLQGFEGAKQVRRSLVRISDFPPLILDV